MPDPKNDQSKVAGGAHSAAYPLDRYTVAPQQENGGGGENNLYFTSQAPSIGLPKGGGALKGIDEKFTVNAVNGTSSLEIPLPFTPGRGGFTPQLSIQYNSGSGNSEVGLGWSLGLPAIQRKTDKRLPQYDDDNERDVFLLAGAEDLVPVLVEVSGEWVPDEGVFEDMHYKRYRPRTEGLYARIEYIRLIGTGHSWWKVTTKDNMVTFYGLTEEARIADPQNPGHIFKWLPQVSYDKKGNAMRYNYVTDSSTDIVPAALHECNRMNGLASFTNTYLAEVAYCNREPWMPEVPEDHNFITDLPDSTFLMRMVIDYGEYDAASPQPGVTASVPDRKDPFSDFHACFEIRTYRKAKRFIMFHYFDELDEGEPVAVRSLDLVYAHDGATELVEADQIVQMVQRGYIKTGVDAGTGLNVYHTKSLPAMTYSYEGTTWDKTVHDADVSAFENAPQGLTGPYQWIDLWGEGLPGILTEQAGAYYYKKNFGHTLFAPAMVVAEKPSLQGLGGELQWQDLDADGRRQVVSRSQAMPGYYELGDDQQWQPFLPFPGRANIDWGSPYTRVLDLNGDGRPDVLITEETVWKWYENAGKEGHREGGCASVAGEEEAGPRLLLNDMMQTVYLADMNGDGMTDIVRITNGEVCYWPNMGYGRFGARVTMSGAPLFDMADTFEPRRLTLADVSGTGAADLIYLDFDKCTVWTNLSGNGWSEGEEFPGFSGADKECMVTVTDLRGRGLPSLVWSSPLPGNATRPLHYISFMGPGNGKPYLMNQYSNGMGKTTMLDYEQSTYYYLTDQKSGTPWATRLPFPVHCVSTVRVNDSIGETVYTSQYHYHHGYYDHEEREFRGFGRVDVTDIVGASEGALDQYPLVTRTWYHNGAWMQEGNLLDAFAAEYFDPTDVIPAAIPWPMPEQYAEMPADLSAQEQREAVRALKGMALRQEVYAQDNSGLEAIPYAVTVNGYKVRREQPQAGNRHGVFYTWQQHKLSYTCERKIEDPRIMHELTLDVDEYGNVLVAAQVVYPRKATIPEPPEIVQEVQGRTLMTMTASRYTNDVITDADYRLRMLCETQTFQVTNGFETGETEPAGDLWTVAELKWLYDERNVIRFNATPAEPYIQFRQLSAARILYLSNDCTTFLDFGVMASLGMVARKFTLAFTGAIAEDETESRITDAKLALAGYIRTDLQAELDSFDGYWPEDDYYWLPGELTDYDAAHFYTPLYFRDPWDNETSIAYWDSGTTNYYLLPHTVTDPMGNVSTVTEYNWYNLQPAKISDINNNESHILYDALGLPTAVAVMEKAGAENGDTLAGLDPVAEEGTAAYTSFFADPIANAAALLQGATWRCLYRWGEGIQPCAAMIGRVWHDTDITDPADDGLLIRITYTDGLGRIAMQKTQAAPAEGDTAMRWIAGGKTIYNNKGKPVKQYEPYYTTAHTYDGVVAAEAVGVSPLMHYDPMGRVYRTDLPDGSYTRTVWTAWLQEIWDNNDTVADSAWYSAASTGSTEEQDAAEKALLHAGTPTVVHLDTMARPFYTIQKDGLPNPADPPHWMYPEYENYVALDIQGHRQEIHDARGVTTMTYRYNMLGAAVAQQSADSGMQYLLTAADGKPAYGWDADDRMFTHTYDGLLRLVSREVTPYGGSARVLERYEYGEDVTDDLTFNLRGQVVKVYDGAGITELRKYDFKGGVRLSERTMVSDATQHPDWTSPAGVSMDTELFVTLSEYDGLGRLVKVTYPDDSGIRYRYNETGQLYRIDVINAGGTIDTDIINELYYNARGQRIKVKYENGATTSYTYDPDTFRMSRIRTTRSSDSAVLQDLNYWYDPVGNIIRQTDDAQQSVYFDGTVAAPGNTYTYDALYRLILCKGREHAGSNSPVSSNDGSRCGYAPLTADHTAMRSYAQYYKYDEVGNMLEMKHTAAGGTGNWTRTFEVENTGGGSPVPINSRLHSSSIGSDPTGSSESYSYDARGNIVGGFNHLYTASGTADSLYYNDENRLESLLVTGSITTWYQYDSHGQRVRKTKTDSGSGYTHQTLYMGGYEVYRKIVTATGTIELERETLHVMDGETRVAVIDTPTIDTVGTGEVQTLRYQYSNHLGTASLELDVDADVISYEEYYPYGNTSFQAGRSAAETSLKRYRYVGKERDEESGFYYIGARYYCPWLARWLAVDPLESKYVPESPYNYCHNNPVMLTDETGMGPDDETSISSPDNVVVRTDIVSIYGSGGELINREETTFSVPKSQLSDYKGFRGKATLDVYLPGAVTIGEGINTGIISVAQFQPENVPSAFEDAWDAYKTLNPIQAGVLKGTYDFAAGMITGLLHAVTHPDEVLTGLAGLVLAADPIGRYTPLGMQTREAISTAVSGAVDKFENGDAYTRTAMITEGSLTLGSLFVGLGEMNLPKATSRIWEVGAYSELRGVEAGLEAHHVGQKALMYKLIPGYDMSDAPSILVPRVGHTSGSGILARSRGGTTMTARQVLARDIFELRRVYKSRGIPNEPLQKLIQMNKEMYPLYFIK